MQNIGKVLDHLKKYTRIDSKYFWSGNEIFSGNSDIIWGLLNNLYKIFHIKRPSISPAKRISTTNDSILDREMYKTHEIEVNKAPSSSISPSKPMFRSIKTPIRRSKTIGNQLYSEIHYNSRTAKKRPDTTLRSKSSLKNINRSNYRRSTSTSIIIEQSPIMKTKRIICYKL